MMPRLSGYDVIDHLAEMSSRPAVVVVTALNDARLTRLDSSVVSSILRKPFDIEMLSAVLTELADSTSAGDNTGNVIDFRAGS